MISRIEVESSSDVGSAAAREAAPWQRDLRRAVSTVGELLERLELSTVDLPGVADRVGGFPLKVPLEFVARMRPGDPNDPLLRQVLPLELESNAIPGFVDQPLEEHRFSPVPGLIHKYAGRVLLVTTGACAVHCRYCFRRNFPYAEQHLWVDGGRAVLDYIAADPSIAEVILSGGDPLVASDRRLAVLAAELDSIPHLEVLRIHTRLPIVLPSRVDPGLLGWLKATRLRKVIVLHGNHANEIDASVGEAVAQLSGVGCSLLNQAVLLAGVNDSIEAQAELSRVLFRVGVLPYYLHLLDRVQGAAQFEVSAHRGREIIEGMRERLPGYLVPRLVREEPGALAKVPV